MPCRSTASTSRIDGTGDEPRDDHARSPGAERYRRYLEARGVSHDGRRAAILAIDTATTPVVIATGSPDGVADGISTWAAGYRHGETLLPVDRAVPRRAEHPAITPGRHRGRDGPGRVHRPARRDRDRQGHGARPRHPAGRRVDRRGAARGLAASSAAVAAAAGRAVGPADGARRPGARAAARRHGAGAGRRGAAGRRGPRRPRPRRRARAWRGRPRASSATSSSASGAERAARRRRRASSRRSSPTTSPCPRGVRAADGSVAWSRDHR